MKPLIYYDEVQEGYWFQGLNDELADAQVLPFPSKRSGDSVLSRLLAYDRPDVILLDGDKPVLVVERTTEVPSGHNVGQRFARLVAAAQAHVPVVYFGPYMARKHGGATEGPRYMNLRLFQALRQMSTVERSPVTTINWPVDLFYEIIQDGRKDDRVKAYLEMLFSHLSEAVGGDLFPLIMNSEFEREQETERQEFIKNHVRNSEQYSSPPDSVQIGSWSKMSKLAPYGAHGLDSREVVLYDIGMNYIRADPYTGMGMLYSYLYCGGVQNRTRYLVLHMPSISFQDWRTKASGVRRRKDIDLYRIVADAILFSDHLAFKGEL